MSAAISPSPTGSMGSMGSMVRCRNLSYAYPGSANTVLRQVSFDIAPGTLTCLAGPNGSGKSTLLLLLAGLLHAQPSPSASEAEATIQMNGASILLPHDPDAWLLGATVLEDLWLGLPPADEAARQRAVTLARRFGLEPLFEHATSSLSFGQKRKLCLASALATDPPLLLLDEPLIGLDYPSLRELRAILAQEKAAGRTLLLSTHDIEPLADMADGVLLLQEGQVRAHLPVSESLPLLEQCGVRPPCGWLREGVIVPWEAASDPNVGA